MQKKQMSSIKRRKYDQNFKQEVLKMTDNQIQQHIPFEQFAKY